MLLFLLLSRLFLLNNQQCLRSDPDFKQCKESSKLVRSISRYLNRLEDEEEKDATKKAEDAQSLIEVKNLPPRYLALAHFYSCKFNTQAREYTKARGSCQFVMDHRDVLPEGDYEIDAICFMADGLIAEEKYGEAIKLLQDESNKENHRNVSC